MRRDLEARLHDGVAGEAREGGYPGLSAQSRWAARLFVLPSDCPILWDKEVQKWEGPAEYRNLG